MTAWEKNVRWRFYWDIRNWRIGAYLSKHQFEVSFIGFIIVRELWWEKT